jgi:hypothetical protein
VTAERYTVVFTGLFNLKKPGEYPYLTMSDDPSVLEGSSLHHGRPPYEHMGREIFFKDLPETCRRMVLEAYRELWGLRDTEGAA